jgi:hypothetical protein
MAEDAGCFSCMVRAMEGDQENEAANRLQQLHELKNFVHATVHATRMCSAFHMQNHRYNTYPSCCMQ